MDRSKLATASYTTSHLVGAFQLRSGRTASEYFDKYRFESDPILLRAVAEQAADHILLGTEVLEGLELGGVPVATSLALESGLPVVFVWKAAKPYGTKQLAVNLEMPWQRTRVGFDSRDLILDVTASDDLSSCSFKDDEQLSGVTEQGRLTAADAAWIREQGRGSTQRVPRRVSFDADWSRFAPDAAWPVPEMPAHWSAAPAPALAGGTSEGSPRLIYCQASVSRAGRPPSS